MARSKRDVPEINAGSMADIAFLLLIFFLVTTTMDVDSGISAKLPPIMDQNVPPPPPARKRNLFEVLVNSNDQLLVEGDYAEIEDLRRLTRDFLDNNGKGTCDYCQGKKDPSSSDSPQKAIISLQNDRRTSYKMYVAVQNELVAAINELRNDLSERRFGSSYEELTKDQKKEIAADYPQKISEAEPLNL